MTGNDERGLLFRSGDAGDLAEKLSRLIQNESLRKDFGARAANFARTQLRVEIAAVRMAEIYRNVLERKAAWDSPVQELAADRKVSQG